MANGLRLHPLGILNRALLALLLVATVVLVIRLTILAHHADQSFVAVSDDLDQIAATAGQLSRDVNVIRTEVTNLQVRLDEAIPDEAVREAWRRADATASQVMGLFKKEKASGWESDE